MQIVRCPVCGKEARITCVTLETGYIRARECIGYEMHNLITYNIVCIDCGTEISIKGIFDELENWRKRNTIGKVVENERD